MGYGEEIREEIQREKICERPSIQSMEAAQPGIAICAHKSRVGWAEILSDQLGAPIALDDGTLGSLQNHDNAWKLAAQQGSEWSLVLEDDVLPVESFSQAIVETLRNSPSPVCSLYIGTGRPNPARTIATVNKAQELGASWLVSSSAIWGPAIALRTELVYEMLDFVSMSRLPYDQRLSQFLRNRKILCVYTFPSLVDHLDGDSLIGEKRKAVTRKAHIVGVPENFDGPCLEIETGKVYVWPTQQ